jgi:hypothetical protein
MVEWLLTSNRLSTKEQKAKIKRNEQKQMKNKMK